MQKPHQAGCRQFFHLFKSHSVNIVEFKYHEKRERDTPARECLVDLHKNS